MHRKAYSIIFSATVQVFHRIDLIIWYTLFFKAVNFHTLDNLLLSEHNC
jgi:hypothetical protein